MKTRTMAESRSISAEDISRLFGRNELFVSSAVEDDADNPAALPPASLNFLRTLCRDMAARTAFEFGSGKSTGTFLEEGLELTSIEDSEYWREKTCASLSGDLLSHLNSRSLPLHLIWTGMVPMMAWRLPEDLQALLRSADIVLIDSPLYTGFREAVLCRVLSEPGVRLVVLDDLRIPSIERFCERISRQNPGLHYRVVEVGHRFALFGKTTDNPLKNRHGIVDALKGWRLFLRYPCFLRQLKQFKV